MNADAEMLERINALDSEDRALLAAWADSRYFPDARDKQVPPPDDWSVWLLLAGRGFGKTRVGAEWIVDRALAEVGDYAVIAPTYAGARDTCIEDRTSGVLAVLRRRFQVPKLWNRSIAELRLANGSRLKVLSADEPDRARGWNFSGAWCDEIGAWRYEAMWYEALIPAIRIGERPRVVVTTTPRPTVLIRDLVSRDGQDVHVTRGSTWENAENLSTVALAELKARYGGTRLGRQELEGELLEDVEGALWQRHWIDAGRVNVAPDLLRVVVAIDPAMTATDTSDETGIVAVGTTEPRSCPHCGPLTQFEGPHVFVLADATCKASPDGWARRAIDLYDELGADRIVAEVNNGGDLVKFTLQTVRRSVPVQTVRATRGKHVRADPVSSLYEQGRVHHVGSFAQLEDQLCTWTPEGPKSPDRLDALVWAVTALAPWAGGAAHSSGQSMARRTLPAVSLVGQR